MTRRPDTAAPEDYPPLVLTRVLAAPRTKVWRAWTDPTQLALWWGPRDFTNPRCEFDPRAGGAIHIDMQAPDGVIYPMTGTVQEFAPPDRLVFTSKALDETGSAHFEVLNTITLLDETGGTRLTVVAKVIAIHSEAAAGYLKGQAMGWSLSLDRLDAMIIKSGVAHGDFTIERSLRAPPSRVFAAWATKEAKTRWFAGGKGYRELRRDFNFEVGGREQLKGVWDNGTTTQFDACYFDIVPNERIVYAYEMHLNGRRISVSLATVEFRPAGNGTRLVVTGQGAFLDGYEDGGSREQGTGGLLDRLVSVVDDGTTTR